MQITKNFLQEVLFSALCVSGVQANPYTIGALAGKDRSKE
jgi:hypothetical protein